MRAAAAAFTFALGLFRAAATVFSLRLITFTATAAFFTFATTTATAALVDVAVSNLFFSRGTHLLDCDVEVQMLACQRVVAVDGDFVTFNFNHADGYRTLVGIRLKLHAGLKVFDTLEAILGHDLFKRRVWLAVAISRIDANFGGLASLLTYQSCFEAWNDVTMTVKINQWLSRLRLINQSSLVVF